MDWDNFLLKRAKEDLSSYKNFNNLVTGQRFGMIQIKEGKFSLKYPGEFSKTIFFESRQRIIPYMFNTDLSELPDCKIPIYLYDSYDYADNFSFTWAKPYNKPGLLFPCWSFYNWEKTVKEFDKAYIPWKDRSDEPYFRGADSTKKRSNIRKLFQQMYPENITLDHPVVKPIAELMNHKIVFDLPGQKPWSIRTPYINLSGSASLRVFHYYPKWGETPWIQFFEDPKDLHGIMLESNWDKPLKEEQIRQLEDELPEQIRLLHGKRAQNRAEKLREKMKTLTTQHMLNYIKFICTYIGEKQDL